MNEGHYLAQRFEEHRSHLRAVAYRMLSSLSEVDDAVQETWLRLSADAPEPAATSTHGSSPTGALYSAHEAYDLRGGWGIRRVHTARSRVAFAVSGRSGRQSRVLARLPSTAH